MSLKYSNYIKRLSASGVHLVELLAGLIVLVPLVLYGIDYACLLYAGQLNATGCAGACRSAANGPPACYTSDRNTPSARAKAFLSRMHSAGGIIVMKKTVGCVESVQPPYPPTAGGSESKTTYYGGSVTGQVTIKTRCDVFPPFALPFVTKHATLYATQSYPITWVMPGNYTTSAPGPGRITNQDIAKTEIKDTDP